MIKKILRKILARRVGRLLRAEYGGFILPNVASFSGELEWHEGISVMLDNGISIDWTSHDCVYIVSFPNGVMGTGAIHVPITFYEFGDVYPLQKIRTCIDVIVAENAVHDRACSLYH